AHHTTCHLAAHRGAGSHAGGAAVRPRSARYTAHRERAGTAVKELAHINRKGGLVCAEAYAVHRDELAAREAEYDPRVASRILRGRNIDCADYIELHAERSRWQMAVEARLHGYDALLLPTVPIVAPTIAELEASDDAY